MLVEEQATEIERSSNKKQDIWKDKRDKYEMKKKTTPTMRKPVFMVISFSSYCLFLQFPSF